MTRIVTTFAVCGVLSVIGAVAFSATEQPESPTMLSHLAVGQQVKLERTAPGYNIVVLNQRYIDALQESGSPGKIVAIGRDFVRIDADLGVATVVAAHAIGTITLLSAEYGTASEDGAERDAEK